MYIIELLLSCLLEKIALFPLTPSFRLKIFISFLIHKGHPYLITPIPHASKTSGLTITGPKLSPLH